MENQLHQTLNDIVTFFESLHIEYALIGGLASSLHGRVRVTEDVDIIVLCDVEQALRTLPELERSAFDWQYCMDTARQLEEAIGEDFVCHIVSIRQKHDC